MPRIRKLTRLRVISQPQSHRRSTKNTHHKCLTKNSHAKIDRNFRDLESIANEFRLQYGDLTSTYKKAKPSSDIPNWVYGMSDRMGLSVWAKVGVGVGVRRGSTHYYNFESGVSVWTSKFRPEWIKFYDVKYKDYYYANQFTGSALGKNLKIM